MIDRDRYEEAMIRAVGELAEDDESPSPDFAVQWPAVIAAMAANGVGEIDEDVVAVVREDLEAAGYFEGDGSLATAALLTRYFETYHLPWHQDVRDVAAVLVEGDDAKSVASRTGHKVKKVAVILHELKEDSVIGLGHGSGSPQVLFVDQRRLKLL